MRDNKIICDKCGKQLDIYDLASPVKPIWFEVTIHGYTDSTFDYCAECYASLSNSYKDPTLEDIKREADRLGYYISLNKKIPRLLPCVCGCNRRERVYKHVEYHKCQTILRCKKCGLEAIGMSEKEAVENWNNMIKERSDISSHRRKGASDETD